MLMSEYYYLINKDSISFVYIRYIYILFLAIDDKNKKNVNKHP